MILYFLKSASCLVLLLAFYHLVLEKEKMHHFNRFYLLGSVLFSFLAPLYIIYTAPITIESTQFVQEIYPIHHSFEKESINYTQLCLGIYATMSMLLLLRFGRNLFVILQKIKKNKQVNYQNATLVLIADNILPHTFWNCIFINKNDFENQKIEKELFTHELTHVTQKHTLDILILEFVQIIFWINPFFILLKKAVQLNHEFLADENVINQHKNTFQYQHLLVNKASWKNDYYLASNLNYSLTKKRLLMMTTQSSRTNILFKKLAVIPLLAGTFLLFAKRVEAQEKTTNNTPNYEQQKDDQRKNEFRKIIDEIGEKYAINPYDKLNKAYEIERNKKPHFVKSNAERQKTLTDLFSNLVTIYNQLSSDLKAKTKSPIHPQYPYVQLVKDKKVFYKLKSELTKEDQLLLPPPPPVPNASKEEILKAERAYKDWQKRTGNNIPPPPPPIKSIDHIHNMTKKGATFYFETEKIDAAKAAELVKNNQTLSIETKNINNDKYQVWITKKGVETKTKEENITYYLDHKRITKEEMELIPTDKIASVDVKKNKDGTGSVYITTKK
tara:strand:+ start:94 stop:1764 length:1671 start_codon:yes stop_codon:yes gene_type:complete